MIPEMSTVDETSYNDWFQFAKGFIGELILLGTHYAEREKTLGHEIALDVTRLSYLTYAVKEMMRQKGVRENHPNFKPTLSYYTLVASLGFCADIVCVQNEKLFLDLIENVSKGFLIVHAHKVLALDRMVDSTNPN